MEKERRNDKYDRLIDIHTRIVVNLHKSKSLEIFRITAFSYSFISSLFLSFFFAYLSKEKTIYIQVYLEKPSNARCIYMKEENIDNPTFGIFPSIVNFVRYCI